MPYSSLAGKEWIGTTLQTIGSIERVLDVGVGAGTYSKLFRSVYSDAEWVGVEIWGPYIEHFDLHRKYDELYIGDIRHMRLETFGSIDVCFLGDVLEHMAHSDACKIIDQLLNICRYIFVSVPVGVNDQGSFNGNPFEKHVAVYDACSFPDVFPDAIDSSVFSDGTWTIGVAVLSKSSPCY